MMISYNELEALSHPCTGVGEIEFSWVCQTPDGRLWRAWAGHCAESGLQVSGGYSRLHPEFVPPIAPAGVAAMDDTIMNVTDIGPVREEVLSGARQDAFVRVSVGNDGNMEGRHDGGEYPSLRDAQQAPGVYLPVHWTREEIWERRGGTPRLVALCTPESGGEWVVPE